MIRRVLASWFFAIFSLSAHADISDCTNLYVGAISIYKNDDTTVVFFNSPKDGSGSYALNFDNWSPEAKKKALALLTSAKISGHRITLQTEATDKCSIGTAWQTLSVIHLQNNK